MTNINKPPIDLHPYNTAGPALACDVAHLWPVDVIDWGGDWGCLALLWVWGSNEHVLGILDGP